MKEIINNDIVDDNGAEQNALADIEIGLSNSPLMNDVKNMTEQELSEDHTDDGELKEQELDIVDLSVNYKNLPNEDESEVKDESSEEEISISDESVEEQYVIDGEIVDNSGIVGPKFKDIDEVIDEATQEEKEATMEDKSLVDPDIDFNADDIAPYISKTDDITVNKNKKKDNFFVNNKKIFVKIGIIAACFVIVISSIVFIAQKVIADNVNFTDFSDTVAQEEQFDTESVLDEHAEVVQTSEFNWDMIKGNPTYDENIYNILIVGGDIAGKKDARGNSDTLIIVSIDKNTKKIKLSSIMRDTYVPIPGYRDNKINSAYATGGVPLIKQVIEENFKVTIDSSVVVNYTTFVKVIDKLGGVKDVVLNSREARFINRECNKHGISSNLKEGTYDLNANQALHFARIRKINSDVYGHDDFGRTARQRFVINQLFKQYKNLNYAQLAGILTSVMGELEIDEVLKKDIFLLAQVALKFNADSLDEFRLPMDNAFSFASVPLPGTNQNMSVVKIDNYWQTNVDALHEFIYGTTEYDK